MFSFSDIYIFSQHIIYEFVFPDTFHYLAFKYSIRKRVFNTIIVDRIRDLSIIAGSANS